MADLEKFFNSGLLRGIVALFILFIIFLSIFQTSFAVLSPFRIIPYFLSDRRPSIVLHIDGKNATESNLSVTIHTVDTSGAIVPFTASAKDEAGVPASVNCNPHGLIKVPFGKKTIITCTATDTEGIKRTDRFSVNVRDLTPPTIQQHEPLYIRSFLTSGVFLNYKVNVSDPDSPYSYSCTPKPRTLIPAANISVTCSAKDPAGNISPKNMTFPVVVQNATIPPLPSATIENITRAAASLATTSLLPSLFASELAFANAAFGSMIHALCGNQSVLLGSGNRSDTATLPGENIRGHVNPLNIELSKCNIPALNRQLNNVGKNVSKISETISRIAQSSTSSQLPTINKTLGILSGGIKNLTSQLPTINKTLGILSGGIKNLSGSTAMTPVSDNLSPSISRSTLGLDSKLGTLSGDIKNLSTSVSKARGSTSIGILPLELVIALLAAGAAIAAAFIAYWTNRWVQGRQERIEMSKLKMQTITMMLPLYGQLATYHKGLSLELMKMKEEQGEPPNWMLCFFYVCKILLEKRLLSEKYGGFVLGDLDAEEIIAGFTNDISIELKKMGPVYSSKIISLVEKNVSYHEFCKKLTRNKRLYKKFRDWLLDPSNRYYPLLRIAYRGKWFNELIVLEINHIFYRWYGVQPSFYRLSEDLQKYLLENFAKEQTFRRFDKATKDYLTKLYTNYYNRLARFETERLRSIRLRR